MGSMRYVTVLTENLDFGNPATISGVATINTRFRRGVATLGDKQNIILPRLFPHRIPTPVRKHDSAR